MDARPWEAMEFSISERRKETIGVESHLLSNPHKRMGARGGSHSIDGYADAAVCAILEADGERGTAGGERGRE